MIKKLFSTIVLAFCLFSILSVGLIGITGVDDVYINPYSVEAVEFRDGTFEHPYKYWSEVTFDGTKDYRQKCGTSHNGVIGNITVNGSAVNNLIVGAYYDDGGSPAHEDDDPSFGNLCGNGAEKPIITTSFGDANVMINSANGGDQYLDVNSIQFKDVGTVSYLKSNYNRFRYCYVYHAAWGVRVGLSYDGDYNTLEYNFMDLATAVGQDEVNTTYDCIGLGVQAQNNTVQHNHFTGYDHGGVFLINGDSNVIQDNYFYSSGANAEDCGVGTNAISDNNIIRRNRFLDVNVAVLLQGGTGNEVYYNNMSNPTRGIGPSTPSAQGLIQIQANDNGSHPSSGNLIYNNTLYDNKIHPTSRGILFYALGDNTSVVEDNVIKNNIIHTVGGYAIEALDDSTVGGLVGSQTYENNIGYAYGTNKYAYILGSDYSTATLFNARGDAADNYDSDPQLTDPANGMFAPVANAFCLGKGQEITVGVDDDFDDALDPELTGLTASPPVSSTIDQDVSGWNIGSYAKAHTNYYIDPDWTGNTRGTFVEPYAAWPSVTFNGANDYRQKCGTSETVSIVTIPADADGTADNKLLIGAYYNDGGVVHEDDNPSYGTTCGNAAAKPIIIRDANDGTVVQNNADHVEFNSIQVMRGSAAIWSVDGTGIEARYCSIGEGSYQFGITIRSTNYNTSNHIIEHNRFYNNYDVYGGVFGAGGGDAINIGSTSGKTITNAIVRYNYIDSWEHSGVVIRNDTSYCYVYQNEFTNDQQRGYKAIDLIYGAHHNYIYDNYSENNGAGCQFLDSSYNHFYNNILNRVCNNSDSDSVSCDFGEYHGSGERDALFNLQTTGYAAAQYNKIYNNIFLGYGRGANNGMAIGLQVYSTTGSSAVDNNEFSNNIIALEYTGEDRAAWMAQNGNTSLEVPLMEKNTFFHKTESVTLSDLGTTRTLSQYNTQHSVVNQEADPKWTDEDNDDFTLQSDSPVIGYAKNQGSPYDGAWLANFSREGLSKGDQDDHNAGTAGWEGGPIIYTTAVPPSELMTITRGAKNVNLNGL